MEDWQERIHAVLGEDDTRCARNSLRWRVYLLASLPLPIRVTGMEDFPWEEPYLITGWNKHEYAKLKKTKPSYTDTFDLLDIAEPEKHDDLVAVVRRTTDARIFRVELSYLRTENEQDPHYTTLNDYSVWHCNY